MKKVVFLVMLLTFLFGLASESNAQIPECTYGSGLYNPTRCYELTTQTTNLTSSRDILDILVRVGGYLVVVASIMGGIVIIVAGLFYMSAGCDTGRLTTAKAIFKNGIIGALILFAAGTIIGTIAFLATDPWSFFS